MSLSDIFIGVNMKNIGVKSAYTLWVKGVQVPDDCEIKVGDKVIIEDNNGIHLVNVVAVDLKEYKDNGMKFLRKAEDADIKNAQKNVSKCDYARKLCNKYIQELALDMQLKKVYVNNDASKIIFYFTAEARVDFRELVKRLANAFARTRIEMRQISEREEVALMGGVGACGQVCCCTKFLEDFGQVSIKMAKNQSIALNPTKINGYCGKLLCCLAYENNDYLEAMKTMPKVGTEVKLPDGTQGIVHYNHLIKKIVRVQVQNNEDIVLKEFTLEELSQCNENLESALKECPLAHNDDAVDKEQSDE